MLGSILRQLFCLSITRFLKDNILIVGKKHNQFLPANQLSEITILNHCNLGEIEQAAPP